MKAISYLSWAAGVIAAALMIMGVIALVFNVHLFGVNHIVNYFHMANSFLLATACCLIYKRLGMVGKGE